MSAIVEAELVSSPMLVPRESDLPALTIRQQNFVRHYLDPNNYRNGTEAAKKAGFQGDDNTLGVCAYDLLRNPKIQAHLQHALKQRHISPDEVIAELSDIAIAPWKHFLEVKYGPNNEVLYARLKLTDKIKSLDILSDLLGMKQKELPVPDTSQLVTALCAAIERMRAQREQSSEQSSTTPQLEVVNPVDTTP